MSQAAASWTSEAEKATWGLPPERSVVIVIASLLATAFVQPAGVRPGGLPPKSSRTATFQVVAGVGAAGAGAGAVGATVAVGAGADAVDADVPATVKVALALPRLVAPTPSTL